VTVVATPPRSRPAQPPARGDAEGLLAIAGLTRMSSCDWPGRLVATVFLQGCPWRCTYCHNPELLDPSAPGQVSWGLVRDLLLRRGGLLDGVVFSGGEPTLQVGLGGAIREVLDLGFRVGLHTAGAYPRRLAEMLPLVDWVGLDIKALPEEYREVTGAGGADRAYRSLRLVLDSGVDHEIRITVDPRVHTDRGVRELVERLREAGVRRIVLQEARLSVLNRQPLPVLADPPDWLAVRRSG
jgi:pyruvate formate lyase activating enzyme